MYRTDSRVTAAAGSAAQVAISVVDKATGKPALQAGVTSTLSVTLTNTGDGVPLQAGPPASALTLYLPEYVPAAAIGAMAIALDHWSCSASPDEGALILTYAGAQAGVWLGALAFDITGVTVDASPTDGTFQVNFSQMPGAPVQLTTPLPLVSAPKPGNASLADVLQVSLDSQGSVFVSTALDPLSNTVFLNVKNIGPQALYTGSGNPGGARITVGFTYGDTSGALAPADGHAPVTPPLGSAWNITAGIFVDQTEGWRVLPASPQDSQPTWRMAPEGGNLNLFGTGGQSNVTFAFANIVSLTAIGHTQMTISFTGFLKDDSTAYDPLVMTLDIVKRLPPPTRGLISLFGTDSPVIPVVDQTAPIDIPLRWSMAEVNAVQIFTSFPGVAPLSRTYAAPPATPQPLAYDTATVRIPGTSTGGLVTTTVQAMDAQGGFLNALQYSSYLQLSVFVDPRDNAVYPVVLLSNKYWMAKNLAYNEAGARVYNDLNENLAEYGRLYTAGSGSVRTPPSGWHVPSAQDWEDLVESFADPAAAYTALTGTGEGQLAAVLGGQYVPAPNGGGQYSGLCLQGYYQAINGDTPTFATFDSTTGKVVVGGTQVTGTCLSVRYVKDL